MMLSNARWIAYLLLSLFTLGAAAAPTTDQFGQLPDVDKLRLSPDGNKVASVLRLETEELSGQAVQISSTENDEREIVLFTDNTEFFLHSVGWKDSRHLLVTVFSPSERDKQVGGMRAKFKTRDFSLMVVDSENGEIYKPFSNAFVNRYVVRPSNFNTVIDTLPDDPDHILMEIPSINNGFAGAPTVSKVNFKTQAVTVVQDAMPWVSGWVTDRQHRVRLARKYDDGIATTLVKDIDSGKWRELWPHEIFAEDAVDALGFGSDPNILYVSAYHNDMRSVFRVNLKDSELKKELVLHREEYDIGGHLIYSPKTDEVIGISSQEMGGTHFFDEKLHKLKKVVNGALKDTYNFIFSMTDSLDKFLVYSVSDVESGTFFLGQLDPVKLEAIAYRYRNLQPGDMSPTERITYQSRDGLDIEGFLTTPKGKEAKNLPTVVFPHGGPMYHNSHTFDYMTQFMVSKGFAVLRMNFRGSTGKGVAFRNAGLKNWGKEMQDDVQDGALYLIEKGIADPARMATVGASYGGYASLMGVVKTPDFYQCAISINGVSNVYDLVKDNRQFWRTDNVVDKQIGNDNAELKSISPVNYADKVKVPVLIIHGTDDRQVPIKHGEQMRDALLKEDKDVEYLELENEDHFLLNESNRIATLRAMDEFLSGCLAK
ncbi:prolyl oligopeptidase family serine peptidase [Gilvimarinus sp. SDUM040013]|uniref:Prolyl oligopeptidase family serine peptidase n=1 Tax=Gilvimarinus gilvus TaxID=3058038 RepID=A0ABU4RZ72_9GAMM|nr:prolyl oligopeptidase family serine peptidase [Gilvimarinus sp. SDUM040013]MDO3387646.1 prolyl oligopeptidase family serine peptidase [Gilvimarinus sp. SDUM040013]MDX6848913.1 prolyl oligopeptidase family serine peptidase [Gilvimarinus sp. SDUM040013]